MGFHPEDGNSFIFLVSKVILKQHSLFAFHKRI